MRSSPTALAALSLACAPNAPSSGAAPPAVTLDGLQSGQQTRGFAVVARYHDDAGKPLGGRFVHRATGFELDTLRIDSAPQAFIWVGSMPTSDQGEPHTQEHLLLGKGNKGRGVANLEEMSIAESSAFTDKWRTCYHMHAAVAASFWPVLEASLDALLHPDYTDEEIRREVRNFGVTEKNGALVLEEKGTVYNEMVRSYEQPEWLLWRAAERALYGRGHPLAFSEGGWPDAIRAMAPEDIRRFHRDHYHLANMGMIASLPASVTLDEALRRADEMLTRLAGPRGPIVREDDLPPPAGSPPGNVEHVDYPTASPATPSPLYLVWPAVRKLPLRDKVLLDLFLDAFAGDEGTDLYKLLIDGKTRVLDTGATGVWGMASSEQGMPVFMGLTSVPPKNLTPDKVREIRDHVRAALRRIADAPDGSEALAAFNGRVRSRLVDLRRGLAKAAGSPPGFGYRGTTSFWMKHLYRLGRGGGFERSLTLRPELEAIEALLAGATNPWRKSVADWQLLDVEPTALAGRPSLALLEKNDKERQARIAAETARLQQFYGTSDATEALRRYQAEYDARTAELDALAKAVDMPPFTPTPPMTFDDTLRVRTDEVAPGVPLVAASFEGMAAAELGVAFRLDVVPEEDLLYVALLPTLLSEVGIAGGGEVIPYDEVNERLRKEVLGLRTFFDTSAASGRAELVVAGAGNDADEMQRAVVWMRRVLSAPDWRPENLPRLRDVVARSATALRAVMRGSEEGWLQGPPTAYWRQRWPLYLRAASFLTRAHDAHRLRWLLEDAGPHGDAIVRFLGRLEAAGGLGRARLGALTAALQKRPAKIQRELAPYVAAFDALPSDARATVVKAATDLGEILEDLPDDSLARDWVYLCRQIAGDLARPPADTLAALARVRARVVRAANARLWSAASPAGQQALAPAVGALLAQLGGERPERQTYGDKPLVWSRIADRTGSATPPVHVGLLNRGTQSGLFAFSAPGVGYAQRDEESLLRYLTATMYGGGGAHGIFMKVWGAGLAYSNGIWPSLALGRLHAYAERCPRVPQTLRFMIDEIKRAQPEPRLVDYAIAQAFASRVPDAYESRASAHARDLADGLPPDVVRGFRERLLELRRRTDLAPALFHRREIVYGTVLPGYGPPSRTVRDGVYLVGGPESQLAAYEQYLKEVEGSDATLVRIAPRDFWVPR